MNFLVGLILVLGIIILVHEWGHFIVARLFGVRVDVFSIGFGPRLFGWKRGDTDYRVSALPLGGYVRMAGQDLSEPDSGEKAPTGAPDEVMSKPRWQRACISFAGPAVNLIFAFVLLAGFFVLVGMPYSKMMTEPATIVAFPANAQESAQGLKLGDKIIGVNGVATPTREDAEKAIRQAPLGNTVQIEVENSGAKRTVAATPKTAAEASELLGFYPLPAVIDDVTAGTPAYRAKVKEGDKIVAVDGKRIEYWQQFVELARASKGKTLNLDIERKGSPVQIAVTPMQAQTETGETVYQIGVAGPYESPSYRRVPLGQSVQSAYDFTVHNTKETISVVGRLFSGRVSVKQLTSVVGISRAAGQAVSKGPAAVVFLMALISINLGILNLLPIPILDGGHILLLSIEGIRRRDLSLAFKERFIQVGFVFLLLLFVFVMYNDVRRLLPIHS